MNLQIFHDFAAISDNLINTSPNDGLVTKNNGFKQILKLIN